MVKYKFHSKLSIMKKDQFVLSEGRIQLLKLIDKYGSISKAAEKMGMSYRHAWGIIKKINESLNEDAVESVRGGDLGGKTIVTKAGRELILEYEARKNAVDKIMLFGPAPAITVDGIIVKNNKILLIQRKNPPYKGTFALPGGFVEFKERVEQAVVREVEEETGIKTKIKNMVGVYSAPDRDPRGHTISVVYEMTPVGGRVAAGSDAKALQWFSLNKLPEIAFDHYEIIQDYLKMKKK
jgi:8-oxo-dGTP diphosphatase